MSQREWYYASGNQPVGPISEEQMLELIRSGRVTPDNMVWTQGMPQWQRASEVEVLDPSRPRPQPKPEPERTGGYEEQGVGEGENEGPSEPAEIPTASLDYSQPPQSAWQQSAGPYAYGQPIYQPQVQRPTSVTVFGILNIVFASFNLLCSPLGMIMIFLSDKFDMGMGQQIQPPTGPVAVWMVVSFILGYVVSILLLIDGIGLLKLKRWARRGAVAYGWFAILWTMVGIIVTSALVMSGAYRTQNEAVSAMIGAILGGIIGLIYPVLLLVFMKRPHVIQACNR